MFIAPQLRIFGIGSVNVSRTYTRHGGQIVQDILSNRNLIIDANNVDIRVHIHKEGFHDLMAVTVFEDVTGVSFNNIDRTLVNLYQVNLNGEIWSKIRIIEPLGILPGRVARVEINLLSDDIQGGVPYNFILRTGFSNVTFQGFGDALYMDVDSVRLEGARGEITFPALPTEARPFEFNLSRLEIYRGAPRVNTFQPVGHLDLYRAGGTNHFRDVNGSVSLYRSSGVNGFHNVGGSVGIYSLGGLFEFRNIAGNLEVDGWGARVSSLIPASNSAVIGGDVTWKSTGAGWMRFNQVNGSIDMDTGAASITGREVNGDMRFVASGSGVVNVSRVDGASYVSSSYGAVTLGATGAAIGMRGDVHVSTRTGRVQVVFWNQLATSPSLTFRGFHGNLTAQNVVGVLDLEVEVGGRAEMSVQFRRVAGGTIRHIGSTGANTRHGRVYLLLQGEPSFNLRVFYTIEARDQLASNVGVEIPNGVLWAVNGGGGSVLDVFTSNRVFLRRA